jgi:hypothetical protein
VYKYWVERVLFSVSLWTEVAEVVRNVNERERKKKNNNIKRERKYKDLYNGSELLQKKS